MYNLIFWFNLYIIDCFYLPINFLKISRSQLFKKNYLFNWLLQVLVVAHSIFGHSAQTF